MKRQKRKTTRRYFTKEQKLQMINEYLKGDQTKDEIWRKYTGKKDHGKLLNWMRAFGYAVGTMNTRPYLALKQEPMVKKKSKPKSIKSTKEESFENLQLKKRISELEKQLKDAEMKAVAFSTMVDIAEKEFNIPIRKKYNTKP